MKKLMVTLRNNLTKILLSIFVLFLMFTGISCLDGINSPSSTNPFGPQIILVNVPEDLFGNLCDPLQIEVIVNRELTPNGSTVLFELNSQTIELGLRGCIRGSDTDITSGRALADYLSGLVVGEGEIGTVNVGVTIIPPNGDPQSDFGVIMLKGIDFTPPPEQTITTRQPDDPLSIFVTLQFPTIGIPPTKGILVEPRVVCDLSDPSLGSLSPTSPEIVGRIESGLVITQYTAVNGEGGTQVVSCRLILPNPSDKDPRCDPVPEVDRTLEAIVKIIQSVPEPEPTPTPTPAPTPTPTPPPSIDCTAFNEEIPPGGNTIITATTNTGSLTDVCCDIPPLFQSVPPSFLDGAPPEATVCGLTDANSLFFTKLTAGDISPLDIQFIQIRCCIDDAPFDLMCNLVETQCNVGVTINPDIAPPTQAIEIIADPDRVDANGTATLIATTDPPVPAGTPICFGILFNSSPPSSLFPAPLCVGATSSGEALIKLGAGAVMTMGQSVTVRACIDENLSSVCDGSDPTDFVIVPIVPLPPSPTPTPTPIPTPVPTATPIPTPTIDLVCPDQVASGAQGTCTCSTNLGPGEQLCFTKTSGSTLEVLPMDPNCVDTDSGGDSLTIIEAAMGVMSPMVNLVKCCISGGDDMCDSGDLDDVESVTVVPVPTPTPTPTPTP